jgi:hypothetical protein
MKSWIGRIDPSYLIQSGRIDPSIPSDRGTSWQRHKLDKLLNLDSRRKSGFKFILTLKIFTAFSLKSDGLLGAIITPVSL